MPKGKKPNCRRAPVMVGTLLVALSSSVFAAELTTTFAGGNGQNGNMFDISATGSSGFTITGIAQNFDSAQPISGYQIWVATGGVTGNTQNASAWTLLASTGSFVSNAFGTPTLLPFTTPLSIALTPGQTIGLYLTNTDGSSVAYTNGSGVGSVAASDELLTIYEGYGKAYSVDFLGSTFSPRIWNGTLYYFSGPDAASTLASMQQNASGLRNIFSLQSSYVNPGLSYDCSIFDKNGICVAVSGRNTDTSGDGPEATSGVLTVAYELNPNIRIGGFLEQYVSDYSSGGVNVKNNNPDFGIFGVWSQTGTDEGIKVRAAYRYGKRDLSITRDAIDTAEAGSGSSKLVTEGTQLTTSYGYTLSSTVLASPYLGVRYTNIARNGYTESASDTVSAPLHFDTLRQESTSLLAGVDLSALVAPSVTINGSVGVETDTQRRVGEYSATGVADLAAIEFNGDTRKTRMVGSAGVTYKIDRAQQISAQTWYREEAYGSTATTTGMVTYTVGF
ncbi:autotransporter outer membrane beta-barrel domain-containing protein [Pseudomonas benzenivorans]|uniref:Autotransporter outer membrane beta-barrel domain-containing protein n=1 Tax=Pseudomonas benzenivorans TaxID=556533 RepID=A0ABY5H1G3_9PSED|nr:autotransporter outer membrane beta-barrel domain-containing protein [Pseudomonas benzenivorans]UTW06102.1 autotransporter outer membrane beta-barrel domain-containing protein [Pseudomonas benzenivorans]